MELLSRIWWEYPYLVDFLLYFFFFGAVARMALAKHYGDEMGKRLAIPIGLILALSLVTAQNRFGFRIEKLGPAAVALIGLVLVITAYQLLRHTGIPQPITLLFSGLFTLLLARTLAPEMTGEFLSQYPAASLLGVVFAAALLWKASSAETNWEEKRKPTYPLVRFGILPGKKTLRKTRDRLRKAKRNSRENQRREKKSARELGKAEKTLYNEVPSSRSRAKVLAKIKKVETNSVIVTRNLNRLLRLDRAVREADTTWLKRATSLNPRQLTKEQRQILAVGIKNDRVRIHIEEQIQATTRRAENHTETIREHLRKCVKCLNSGNAAGAAGWLAKAQQEEKNATVNQRQITALENILIRLYKRQEKTLRRQAAARAAKS